MSSPSSQLPAPEPAPVSLGAKLGWIIAVAATFLAVLLAGRILAYTTQVKVLQSESELAQLETQSLRQQLEAERIVTARQIANLKAQPSVEPITFVALTSPQTSESKVGATIAWQRSTLAGAFISDQLVPPAADEEYRLWFVDASGHSVDGGAIKVGQEGTTRATFQAGQPMPALTRITLTREHQGSIGGQPTGPVVLSGTP
jgi:hypothetical protein